MTTSTVSRGLVVTVALSGLVVSAPGCGNLIGLTSYVDGFCVGGLDKQKCYTGPVGTEGQGKCKGGTRTCLADNSGYETACEGEVLPDAEDDCSGRLCALGAQRTCYSGPMGTDGTGICKAGTQTCLADGSGFGLCVGEVDPDVTNQYGGTCSVTSWGEIYDYTDGGLVTSVVTDHDGNVILGAYFSGSIKIGKDTVVSSGSYDNVLVKIEPSGKIIWTKHFGNAAGIGAYLLVSVDAAGNVLIASAFNGTLDFGGGLVQSGASGSLIVAKYDAMGTYQWGTVFGDSGLIAGEADSLSIDSKGNAIFAGSFWGKLNLGGATFNAGGDDSTKDAFLVKLSAANGTHVWSKQITEAPGQAPSSQVIISVKCDAADDLLIAGDFDVSADFGGTPFISAGGLVLAKYDSNGGHAWSQAYGLSSLNRVDSLAIDSAGNLLMVGKFSQTINFGGSDLVPTAGQPYDAFLAKVDSLGVHQWSKAIGFANMSGIAVDGADGIVGVGGLFGSVNLGNGAIVSKMQNDVLLARLDSSGHPLWTKTFISDQQQLISGVVVDPLNDSFAVTGQAVGTIHFSPSPLTGPGLYLTKFPLTSP